MDEPLLFLLFSSYVRFDILQRILSRIFGINVIHVMVITDIDDKIIKRALEVNRRYVFTYELELDKLLEDEHYKADPLINKPYFCVCLVTIFFRVMFLQLYWLERMKKSLRPTCWL